MNTPTDPPDSPASGPSPDEAGGGGRDERPEPAGSISGADWDRVDDLLTRWEENGFRETAAELCAGEGRSDLEPVLRREMRRFRAASQGLEALAASDPAGAKPQIPGFRLLAPAGRGGMGRVWLAEQLDPPREVALKVIAAAGFGSAAARHRFLREAEIAAGLEHENIARIYARGEHRGMAYLVMEFVRGVPLDEYVDRYRLDVKAVLRLMLVVCRAVQYAHSRGVIHRDLKPDNILVTANGKPYVVDFGVAKVLKALAPIGTQAPRAEAAGAAATGAGRGTTPADLTCDGDRPGTLAYMAPEQAAGPPDQHTTATDVFGVGAVLLRLVTGHGPHDLSGTRQEILDRIAVGRISLVVRQPLIAGLGRRARLGGRASRRAAKRGFQGTQASA